jgi:hypothetical protein
MADQDPRDAQEIPMAGFEVIEPNKSLQAMPGSTTVNVQQTYVTAQVVQNPRKLMTVVQKIREMAVVGGERFYYAWDVKNKDGTKSEVSGLSIKGANALAVIYGNCAIEVDAKETDTHFYFKATVIDLETGSNMPRLFRQRKNQSLGGKMDRDRAEDIVFQIGQSKAIRNAVANALDTFATEMLEYARKGVVDRIKRNPEGTLTWIFNTAQKHKITERQLEVYVTRPKSEWTAQHMARLYAALMAIEEGMETANNIFALETATDISLDAKVEEKQQAADTKQGDKPKDAEGVKGRQSNRKPAAEKPADQKTADPGNSPAEPKKAEPPKEEAEPNEPGVSDADLEQLAGWGNEGDPQ